MTESFWWAALGLAVVGLGFAVQGAFGYIPGLIVAGAGGFIIGRSERNAKKKGE